MKAASKILVVDDEPGIRFGIKSFLNARGFVTEEADSCASAREKISSFEPDLVILDYRLPDGVAPDIFPSLQTSGEPVPVVILTAHATIDLAIELTKEGADHLLTKPVELSELFSRVSRAVEARRRGALGRGAGRGRIDPFLGRSAGIRRLRDQVERVRPSHSPILLTGETGTGKSVLARHLHEAGPRAAHAFVDLNCAGLSKELLESELFGHHRGAFTGAVESKLGLLDVAHKGSLFLDEIGDVETAVQPKLLKVLEEGRFRRVGEVKDREVDVRLIAATHQDMSALVRERRFRSDLYFRISTLLLTVPPLRERREDIVPLAQAILEAQEGPASVTRSAGERLQKHPWPGNIRELRNVLERALYMAESGRIDAEHLIFDPIGAEPAAKTLVGIEREEIERALAEEGKVHLAAKRLGIPRSSLYQKLKQYGISVPRRP